MDVTQLATDINNLQDVAQYSKPYALVVLGLLIYIAAKTK